MLSPYLSLGELGAWLWKPLALALDPGPFVSTELTAKFYEKLSNEF